MKHLLIAFLVVFNLSAVAQKKNEAYKIHIRKASSPIKIDGILDEQAWLEADVASDFFMVLPMDTSKAEVRTEVRMTYDDVNLYLIAVNHHLLPGPYMVESLRRDFVFGKNDNFLLFMDTFDDQTNGFSFGANAAGAQWDGTMFEGGKVDLSWDNKWSSQVKNYEDKWIFEMAVPFKTIRYKKGISEWGINFSRLDLKTTEKSSWAPVPRQFPTASLAYTGILVWDSPPPPPGLNLSVIPYALGGMSRDFENETPTEYRKDVGFDTKIGITSSLNLDLTVNPDFSQVDVDRQVTNLDRFELFFPERRQFFLENGDLFANFGYPTIRPFFSRRIGLDAPIRYGARLSGKLNKDWRIGAMDMQTGSVDETALPDQNFAVLALQRRVFARSNIGMIFINKQSLNYTPPSDPEMPVYSQYNRNLGLEYNLASSNNIWTGKALFLKS
ncbi:MAG: carbohydrate binding family 9 domain-containing protein, partial [Cyclobacteriaceae bacterium]|nr:carbohydrate binding family 9 domain-containing protein [Cyclobacteriaceae bacterium]